MLRLFIITGVWVCLCWWQCLWACVPRFYENYWKKWRNIDLKIWLGKISLDYMELLVTCGIESHPMIENYSFARVNLINIHFFLPKQTNVTEKRQMSTNKQASTLFNVLLRFKYVKLQKFTLYVHFFSVQIYRIFQPVYGNLCSLFLWITNNSFVSSFADLT